MLLVAEPQSLFGHRSQSSWLRWILLAAGACAMATCTPAAEVKPAQPLPVLREIRQVLQLNPTEARRNYPVELEAIVTHADLSFGLLFMQDKTAGIYVHGIEAGTQFKPGTRVKVVAVADMGLFSPILIPSRLTKVGEAPLPEPKTVELGELASGGWDCQWLETRGVVQREEEAAGQLHLEIFSGPAHSDVWVQNFEGHAKLKLLDSEVRLRGVAGARFDDQRRLVGFQLYVSAMEDVTVLERPALDAFDTPVRLSRDLPRYFPLDSVKHRVRVEGVVTLQLPDRTVFIRDAAGGIRLQLDQESPLRMGEHVDAVGFRVPGSGLPELQHVRLRSSGKIETVQPTSLSATQLFQIIPQFELVKLEGLLLEKYQVAPDLGCLLLKIGDRPTSALITVTNGARALSQFQPGSRLGVAGVFSNRPVPGRTVPDSAIWVSSPASISALAAPENSAFSAASQTGIAVGIAMLAIGVPAMLLCRRARRQVELGAHESERQLRRYIEEREHIGQDLHDNIIQSIYAVGLGLEDCRRVVARSPEQAQERLSTAVKALNSVIQDVRQFIGGLEPRVLSGREIKTALKSLALTTGDTRSQFVIRVDSDATQHLTSHQATHLLNIAKEAMSNSLRHAQASQTQVTLRNVQDWVRLEIADDGIGFNPKFRQGSGNGFRNMSARAQEMHARLEIVSAPGEGTRVIVDLPQLNST